MDMIAQIAFPLFVPADRPDRFAKALASGADAVIFDLEDAVAPAAKDGARRQLVHNFGATGDVPRLVRVNAVGTPWHEDDLAAVRALNVDGIMIPKAQEPEALRQIVATFSELRHVIALIETAAGISAAQALAGACTQIAFGSVDFAADVGCAHERDALLFARSALVMASRAGGLPPPLDGVSTQIDDPVSVADDAAYAVRLGMGGKLLIHPMQVAPARQGFQPSTQDIAWARKVLAQEDGGAGGVDGFMVDRPVRLRAELLLSRLHHDETA